MAYFLNLFSPETFEAFARSNREISGFRLRQRNAASRVQVGDKLVCYVTKLSRWVGVLEVASEWFEDKTPIFYPVDDPFVIRFRVKALAWLPKEKAIPIHDDRVWSRLSFTQHYDKRSPEWTGKLRQSLHRLDKNDGLFLEEFIMSQMNAGEIFEINEQEYQKLMKQTSADKHENADVESAGGHDSHAGTDGDSELDIEITSEGTEYEDTGIIKPFNPTLIKIDTKQMSLDTLIKRMREGEVDLSPDFQRAEVWRPTARSRLIESLLIRIPLPAFYMDATDEDNWLVVDGLQRLSTLRDFAVDKTMALQDLEFLTQFHGMKHDDLPRNYQRRIEETQITVYLIEKGTPAEVKFNIFKRINTGGLPLSAQEIRHALNQGPVTSYLKLLAHSEEFQMATYRGVSDRRMTARECVLRFLAYTLTPPSTYKTADFDAFLSDAMANLNLMSQGERDLLANRFLRALNASHSVFGSAAFRKPWRKTRTPVNKALFEVWTVAMDNQTDERIEALERSREEVVPKIQEAMLRDPEFLNAVSQGTGDAVKVRLRFERFQSMLQEALP
jgi:predicted RNA-binding protein